MRKLLVIAGAVAGCGWMVLTGQDAAAPAVFTAAQAAAGRTAYESSCGKCHTNTLMGRTGDPAELPPLDSLPAVMREVVRNYHGVIPPLAGPDFMTRWQARTTKELADRIQVAIGGFPPRDTDQDTCLNLTAYLLQANGARAGNQALTAATAVQIRSIAVPPPAHEADER